MKSDNALQWLQEWYLAQCDGDWEHEFGVTIETLDNPGWRVTVSLQGTALEEVPFERVESNRSEHDWVRCWVDEQQFEAACGPRNLQEALEIFRKWAEPHVELTKDTDGAVDAILERQRGD